jgi:hypothetical protein
MCYNLGSLIEVLCLFLNQSESRMHMKQNINQVIFNHFVAGGGAAAYLRKLIPELAQNIHTLFNARSDVQRLQIAEEISEDILETSDFADMKYIRDAVATLEIKRLIKYPNQTDHTIHTVYLFLLGIWIYDNVGEVKTTINNNIHSSKKIKMFVFQWIFASLLHDIGYLFYQGVDENNIELLNKFDEMFTSRYIPNYLSKRASEHRQQIESMLQEFYTTYKSCIVHSNEKCPGDLLGKLDSIPWLDNLEYKITSGLELLKLNSDTDSHLRSFAEKVATVGYGNDPKDTADPKMDHAIASGLMLIKYTSVWYWLYREFELKDNRLFLDLSKDFEYPLGVFKNHVIPACQAVIYHNVSGLQFNLQTEPLLYLAVLCDELQFWDRIWVAESQIDNWKSAYHCMAETFRVSMTCKENENNKINFTIDSKVSSKIQTNLDKKLKDWKDLIEFSDFNS